MTLAEQTTPAWHDLYEKAMHATTNVHGPGVYFDLPEDQYHDDPALGSSDLRKLAKNAADYWWTSWMNPARPPDKSSEAKTRGTAVHVLALYGEAEFAKRYMRGAEHTEEMSPAEKAAATKAANARARTQGRIALPAAIYDSVAIAGAMIAKNPKLANALVGGLNEVSIFWIDDDTGIRKKARIDCLKPRGIGDLKSLSNKFEKPFDKACIDNITNYRYDVQACHYMAARRMIPSLAAAGKVFGSRDDKLLAEICKSKVFAWQFVFWQAEGAPITHSRIISPSNPLLDVARATIEKAENSFIEYMERFGPHEMWLPQEDPSELYLDDMPAYFARD